jgi:hypothetical protein
MHFLVLHKKRLKASEECNVHTLNTKRKRQLKCPEVVPLARHSILAICLRIWLLQDSTVLPSHQTLHLWKKVLYPPIVSIYGTEVIFTVVDTKRIIERNAGANYN